MAMYEQDVLSTGSAVPVLDIRLFGAMSVRVHGCPLPRLRSRSTSWLLALLALRAGREVSRDWLGETLWPQSPSDLAHYNLRRGLADLRRALGNAEGVLRLSGRAAIELAQKGVFVDTARFAELARATDEASLEAALGLYQGQLLEGCPLETVGGARAEHEQRYLSILAKLAELASLRADPAASVRYLRRAVAVDPFHEEYQRSLMRALAECGDLAAIAETYRNLRLRLHREINAFPSEETDALYRQLQTTVRRPTPPLTAARAPAPLRRRLPVPVSSFVGRHDNVEGVACWLREGRLVTLVGTGGVGKTRLSLAVGERIGAEMADGARFVDLAAVTEPDQVAGGVTAALGIADQNRRRPQDLLVDALESRALLLILDNCEHLLEACARLTADLLVRCPQIRVLATSRRPLGITGERIVRVEPLPLPPEPKSASPPEPDDLLAYPSVQLFVARATLVRSNFRLTAENARVVGRVCRRLDGVPLAIELAAARVGSRTVEEIEAMLDDRFTFLGEGNRGALPRHQTLRATIDWSYDLLDSAQQTVFQHLSVFVGGWDIDAAAGVCGDTPERVAEHVATMVEHSLAMHTPHGAVSRYRMLESVREYAQAKLRESGAEEAVRTRHRDHFLALAEKASPLLRGPDQVLWLNQLESNHTNLRAAVEWSRQEPGGAEAELRFAIALEQFWLHRWYLGEGRDTVEAALARAPKTVPDSLRAGGLYCAGALRARLGDAEGARRHFVEGIALYRQMACDERVAAGLNTLGLVVSIDGDFSAACAYLQESIGLHRGMAAGPGLAAALNNLGLMDWYQGRLGEAEARHAESLEIKQRLGNRIGISFSLNNLGMVALSAGDFARARSLLQEAMEVRRDLANRGGVADSLHYLGLIAWCEGDLAAAAEAHRESLRLSSEVGNRGGVANSHGNLGILLAIEGDHAGAMQLGRMSLQGQWEIQDRLAIARSLEGVALIEAHTGQPLRAACFWGAAAALREALGTPLADPLRDAYLRDWCGPHPAGDPDPQIQAALERGRTAPLDATVASALGRA